MRQVTSILISLAFMVSGIMMAVAVTDPSNSRNSYKEVAAATLQYPRLDTNSIELPQDLLLDLAKRQGPSVTESTTVDTSSVLVDSLKQRIFDLEQKGQVTKVKWLKAPAPKPEVIRDTIRETHYFLATQVGNKEGPTGECIPIYEVRKVDELCPEIANSCVDNDVGD